MRLLKVVGSRLSVVKDLCRFFWQRKLWWLIPMLLVFVIMGLLIAFVNTSSTVPFVYVLF
ncbi:MAG: DUF5989 family protein [Elusimicrobia bacterium]|nr:DUF5989 family protein [Elusimicrobiota bacterium]